MVRGFFYCCLDSGFDKLVSTSWFRQAGFDKLVSTSSTSRRHFISAIENYYSRH